MSRLPKNSKHRCSPQIGDLQLDYQVVIVRSRQDPNLRRTV